MFIIRYSLPASRDLIEISEYLEAQADAETARAVLRRIRRQIKALENHALRYRERRELGIGRRAILIGPYLAFYRLEDGTVFVLRILHTARNIKPTMFESE
ncbi:MAG: type II toxin-antitoxin system RelE/ParE family toxin [Hyphomicrobiaceae bacterium]